jgi:hypothetical protein
LQGSFYYRQNIAEISRFVIIRAVFRNRSSSNHEYESYVQGILHRGAALSSINGLIQFEFGQQLPIENEFPAHGVQHRILDQRLARGVALGALGVNNARTTSGVSAWNAHGWRSQQRHAVQASERILSQEITMSPKLNIQLKRNNESSQTRASPNLHRFLRLQQLIDHRFHLSALSVACGQRGAHLLQRGTFVVECGVQRLRVRSVRRLQFCQGKYS